MKSVKIRSTFAFLSFCFFIIGLTFLYADNPLTYENNWLVIIGNYRTYSQAEDVNVTEGYNATILLSTYFENLSPGWYMLVRGAYDTKAKALAISQELSDTKGIDNYLKYTGDLFYSDESKYRIAEYRIAELDDDDYFALAENAFHHIGEKSPDEGRWVFFEDHEEDPEEFPVIRTVHDAECIENLFVFADEKDIAWSPKSDEFVFIDYDAFYNGGDHQLIIVDVFTREYISLLVHDLIEGRDFDGRSMLTVYNLGWLASGDGVIFSMDVDFLGTAGDDMIDKHRIEELGEDFGTRSPVFAGNYIVYLKP